MKESRTVEFKSEISNSFLKTVSAYSNFGTGKILFGINDDGTICGIADPNRARLDIENKINDSIIPKPEYTISVNAANGVVTLTVYEGQYKPYLYKGQAYRRSDTATIEVDTVELRRLTLEGSNRSFEMLPCDRQNLEFEYFEKAIQEKLGVEKLTSDILRTFGFLDGDKKYTVAAGLFADVNPFYGIDAARFGESISEILDRETFSNMSILEQYEGVISLYRRYYQYQLIDGIERKTVDLIPETAFREAIANALVHRTWDVNSHIRVSMYRDRIEIVSPGGLPTGISEEEYLNGNISNMRNPVVGMVMFRLHYIEMFGTGIKRILEAYRGSVSSPQFRVFDNSILVTLPVLNRLYSVTKEGKEILDVLGDGFIMSTREIVEVLGWSKSKVVREINLLIEEGYIKVHGNGRSTKYSAVHY